jgi:DNA-binding transcriptional ArsR family regulator
LSRKRRPDSAELFMDRRVQLLLGKFLSGEIKVLSPTLDREVGYRFTSVEPLLDSPEEARELLDRLQANGFLETKTCGVLLNCGNCGSCDVEQVAAKGGNTGSSETEGISFQDVSGWRCKSCKATFEEHELKAHLVPCYSFSEKSIADVSDWLVIKPLRDFLHERGYRTESPGFLIGESEVKHQFDIVAYSGGEDEGILVMDAVVSVDPISEDEVKSLFAKVFDTNPLKSVIVAFPELKDDAHKLADQYRIGVVETTEVRDIWVKLREVIPPVDEVRFEPLDVMTLLSLPDHLRKTATVTGSLGKATADEISERTERARAVESGYLNQLVRMGYLKKERDGRRVLFSVVS